MASQQTGIVTATWTKLVLPSESYDIGSNWDTANRRFVIPTTGYYAVYAQAQWSNSIAADTRI